MRSEGVISIFRCDWSHRIGPLGTQKSHPAPVELKRRARAGIDLNAREFAERNSAVVQDRGPCRLRMGNDGNTLARMGFRQARKAGEHAALKLAHGLSSRTTAGLALGISAFPIAHILR